MSTENVLLVFDKWWNENSWNPWVIQETNQNIYISKWIGEGYEAKKKIPERTTAGREITIITHI